MKVCIPVEKKEDGTHRIYAHLGTAPIYIFFDKENKKFEFIKNEIKAKKEGGLFNLKEKEVDTLIVRSMGESALEHFRKSGVKVYQAVLKSADENLKELISGNLEELN